MYAKHLLSAAETFCLVSTHQFLVTLCRICVHSAPCAGLQVVIQSTHLLKDYTDNWYRTHNVKQQQKKKNKDRNCVKSVRIRSYSGPYSPAFGLNTERYEDTFYVVRNKDAGCLLSLGLSLFISNSKGSNQAARNSNV